MSWQPPPPPPGPPAPPPAGRADRRDDGRRPPPPAPPAPAPAPTPAASRRHHRIEEWESWDSKHRNEAVLHQTPHRIPSLPHHAGVGGSSGRATTTADSTLGAAPPPTSFPSAPVVGAVGVGPSSAPRPPPLPPGAAAPRPPSDAPLPPDAPVGSTPRSPGRVGVAPPPASASASSPRRPPPSSSPPFDDVPLDDVVPSSASAAAAVPAPPQPRRPPPAAAHHHRIEEWESWDSKHRNPAVLHQTPHETPRLGGAGALPPPPARGWCGTTGGAGSGSGGGTTPPRPSVPSSSGRLRPPAPTAPDPTALPAPTPAVGTATAPPSHPTIASTMTTPSLTPASPPATSSSVPRTGVAPLTLEGDAGTFSAPKQSTQAGGQRSQTFPPPTAGAHPHRVAAPPPSSAPQHHRPKVQEWESWDRRHRNPALLNAPVEQHPPPLAGRGAAAPTEEPLPAPPGPAAAAVGAATAPPSTPSTGLLPPPVDPPRPPASTAHSRPPVAPPPPPRPPPPSALPTPSTRNVEPTATVAPTPQRQHPGQAFRAAAAAPPASAAPTPTQRPSPSPRPPTGPSTRRHGGPKVQEWESWDRTHVNPAMPVNTAPPPPPVSHRPPPPPPPSASSLPHPGPVAPAPPPRPGPSAPGPPAAATTTTSRGGRSAAATTADPTPPPPLPAPPHPQSVWPADEAAPPAPGARPRRPPTSHRPDLPTPQRHPAPPAAPAPPAQPTPSRKLWGQPLHRKERIDPSQIPRPPLFTRPVDAAATIYSPRSAMETDEYPPPPADSRYVVSDDGNANPRSMRCTTFRVPKDAAVRRKTGIDLGLICCPMAVGSEDFVHRPLPEVGSDDSDDDYDCGYYDDDGSDPGPLEPEVESIPVVSSPNGDGVVTPIRCDRCMAYLNPFVRLDRSTTSFVCNFCGAASSVPTLASTPTSDPNLDLMNVPTKFGSVEYEVGGSYDVRKRRSEPMHLYALECNDPIKLVAYLDAVERVGYELGRQWRRQEGLRLRRNDESGRGGGGNGGSGRPLSRPRIGLFFFRRNLIYFPYFKERGKEGEKDDDPELCACVVPDVTTDPFSPLPLESWTHDVSTNAGRDRWRELLERCPDFVGSVITPPPSTKTTTSSGGVPPPSSSPLDGGGTRLSCGGAALAVLADALRECGGRGTLLTSTRPNFGIGFLRDREGGNLSLYARSSSEKSLYSPLQRHVKQGELFFANEVDEKAGAYYRALGEECAKNGVRVDVVVTTPSSSTTDDEKGRKAYLDLATLGELCRVTCGKIKWIRCSEGGTTTGDLATPVDGSYGKLVREELLRSATSFAGADAVFKVRCSAGLQVKSYFPYVSPGVTIDGPLLDSPELELASVGPDDCLAVLLEHKVGGVPNTRHLWPPEGTVSAGGGGGDPMAYFQSALLYTSSTGRRRVRVTTLGLRTSTSVPDVFRSADFGAIAALMARRAVSDLVDPNGGHPFRARDNAVQRCVEVLANYRANTSAKKSPPGQLILPETLQLLPLFCTSLRKNAALRQSLGKNAAGVRSGRPYPDADERAHHLFYVGTASPALTMLFVHPNVFCLSGLREDDGEWFAPAPLDVGSAAPGVGGGGATAPFRQRSARDAKVVDASARPHVRLPRTTHPSMSCLDDDGIYLIDDGFAIHLLVGKSVRPDVVDDLIDFSEGFPSGDLATAESAGGGSASAAVVASVSRSSDFGKKVRRMVRQLRTFCATSDGGSAPVRPTHAPVVVVALAGGAGREADVAANRRREEERIVNLLVEDSTTDERGYVDFLCALHRKIREHMDRQMSSS